MEAEGEMALPCQMVFVLKPLTQSQQEENDVHEDYKHKSRLVICGNLLHGENNPRPRPIWMLHSCD